jgi:acylphosphatase
MIVTLNGRNEIYNLKNGVVAYNTFKHKEEVESFKHAIEIVNKESVDDKVERYNKQKILDE